MERLASVEPAIRASGLVKEFGPVRAVDDVSFELAPGRIYGLLGPNGSGKTTLIRLLTGLTRATSGSAEVLGVTMPSRPNLSRIGYMTQADGVYTALTVRENARFFAATYGVRGDDAVDETLRLVELADRADTIVGTLSGGQRRRLSLACALVHRPPVLFLDEPTVGIDPLLRVQFWAHFRELADAGTTIVVSSHVMDEADRCDELLFVRSGKVIARGTGREIRAGCRDRRPRAGLPPARRRCRGDPMNARRIAALFRRVVQEIRRDRPSIALLFIAPIIITGLLTFILREGERPTIDAVVVNQAGQPGRARRRRARRGAHEPGSDGRHGPRRDRRARPHRGRNGDRGDRPARPVSGPGRRRRSPSSPTGSTPPARPSS